MHKSSYRHSSNKKHISLILIICAVVMASCNQLYFVEGRSSFEATVVSLATNLPSFQQDATMIAEDYTPSPTPSVDSVMQTYVVQGGDTLLKIAKRFGTTVDAIVLENNIVDRNRIYPGQILRIPTTVSEQVTPSPLFTPTTTLTFTPTPTATELTVSPTVTISSTPAMCSPTISDIPVSPNPTLVETFDTNNEWNLSSNVAISNGELSVMSTEGINFVVVPNIDLPQFYLGVDVKIMNASDINAVIGFGNLTDQRDYHFFTLNNERIDIYQVVDGRERFTSSTQINTQFSCYQRIELIYFGDQVQIFLNGEITSIAQLPVNGNQIALGAQNWRESGQGSVFFDNLEIGPSRN